MRRVCSRVRHLRLGGTEGSQTSLQRAAGGQKAARCAVVELRLRAVPRRSGGDELLPLLQQVVAVLALRVPGVEPCRALLVGAAVARRAGLDARLAVGTDERLRGGLALEPVVVGGHAAESC